MAERPVEILVAYRDTNESLIYGPAQHTELRLLLQERLISSRPPSLLISRPEMQAVYICEAEETPLSSPTRCFIPKRDYFSKINGESQRDIHRDAEPLQVATKSELSK